MKSCVRKWCFVFVLALSPSVCDLSLANAITTEDVVRDESILLVSISSVLPDGQFPIAVKDSTIDLPLIERVNVIGLDTKEIRMRIIESYKNELGKGCDVQVEIKH